MCPFPPLRWSPGFPANVWVATCAVVPPPSVVPKSRRGSTTASPACRKGFSAGGEGNLHHRRAVDGWFGPSDDDDLPRWPPEAFTGREAFARAIWGAPRWHQSTPGFGSKLTPSHIFYLYCRSPCCPHRDRPWNGPSRNYHGMIAVKEDG